MLNFKNSILKRKVLDGPAFAPFLRWFLFSSLISASFFLCYLEGVFYQIWVNDITKLSFVILFMFVVQTLKCGQETWLSSSNRIDNLLKKEEAGWFVSDLFLSIGMAGTVIGFISMLGGFASINVEDTATIQALIKQLGLGMSTALYTTLVGIVCSILLKIQYFNLSQVIRKDKDE